VTLEWAALAEIDRCCLPFARRGAARRRFGVSAPKTAAAFVCMPENRGSESGRASSHIIEVKPDFSEVYTRGHEASPASPWGLALSQIARDSHGLFRAQVGVTPRRRALAFRQGLGPSTHKAFAEIAIAQEEQVLWLGQGFRFLPVTCDEPNSALHTVSSLRKRTYQCPPAALSHA